MELDWTTFILEIANFLILVWIMNRLLYRPVMDAVASRRAVVAKKAAEAENLRREAADLETRYRSRLDEWEEEKEKLRQEMLAGLAAERGRLEAALHESLQRERDREKAIREQELRDQLRNLEEVAVEQGSSFAAALLKDVASPELEGRLQDLFLTSLPRLAEEQLSAVAEALREPGITVLAASAFPCAEERRSQLRQSLAALCGYQGEIEFVEEPEIIAGLQLRAGPWILDASLHGELAYFREAAHAEATS